MDELLKALHLAVALESAEGAKQPYQCQIDAFMQQEGELDDDAQAAFEDWALARMNVNRAFRRLGFKPQEHWISHDYNAAATQQLVAMTPLGGFDVPET